MSLGELIFGELIIFSIIYIFPNNSLAVISIRLKENQRLPRSFKEAPI